MLLKIQVDGDELARLDRLRDEQPLVTRRAALAHRLLELGLAAVEADPVLLVRPTPRLAAAVEVRS